MKIGFIAAANSPHTIKWVNAMIQKGHEAAVFSMPDHEDKHKEISEQAQVHYLPFNLAQNGVKKNAKALRELVNKSGFDVINAIDASSYGFLAARAKLSHLLLTLTGKEIYVDAMLGKKGFIKKSLKQADAVLMAAANSQTQLTNLFKIEKKYFVVPFGVDMELFSKKDTPKNANSITFCSYKMLEESNGVDMVIEAFSKFLKDWDGSATLKIAGEGSLEKQLQQQAQSLGIGAQVEFLGYVPNAKMPDVFNTSDIAVQMSTVESFGVGGVESMACEVPVVASDTIGASEYILNGVTGYLVKVGNTNTCAERMLDLARDADGRHRMGASARDDVQSLYNLEQCADKYEEALKAIL